MGLIDADALKEYCMNASKSDDEFRIVSLATLASEIDAQPTAYDVGKVVRQLEEIRPEEDCFDNAEEYKHALSRHNKIIEIVEGGGVDAKTDS